MKLKKFQAFSMFHVFLLRLKQHAIYLEIAFLLKANDLNVCCAIAIP